MLIAKIKDNTVLEIGNYKTMFLSNVFPDSGPTPEWMEEHSCMHVNMFKPYNNLTEKLESCSPYIEGEWVYTVQVSPLTEEEITSHKASAKDSLRVQRNRLLSETDWRFRSDLNPSAEWVTYCQALRDFPATIEDARLPYTFPSIPQ